MLAKIGLLERLWTLYLIPDLIDICRFHIIMLVTTKTEHGHEGALALIISVFFNFVITVR